MPNKYNTQAQRQELDRLVRERAWNRFRIAFTKLSAELENCRSVVECRTRQTSHRTLLHHICDLDNKHPPVDIVILIANSCPHAMFSPDSKQRLPIHLAIRKEVGIDTVKALIESIPKESSQYSIEKMLLHLDSSNSTPILLATKVNAGNREEIIKYLARLDTSGKSLLKHKCISKKENTSAAPLKYVATRESMFVDDGLHSPDDLLRFMIVRTYWAKMKELMADLYNIDDFTIERDESHECLLQAAIICHEMFGSAKMVSSIISAIIRNGLFQANYRDSFGNSTLHITCLSGTSKFDQILKLGQRETSYGINGEDCTLMEHLIKTNADSFTNFVERNNFGDIPLHCAIRAGKDILHIKQLLRALEQSARVPTQKRELPIHLALKCGCTYDIIMVLWRAYTDGALVPDKSTGLFLFQLTAVKDASSQFAVSTRTQHLRGKSKKQLPKRYNGDYNELKRVSLCYFFLRERPDVIRFFQPSR